jgi:hypothetical protein
MFVKLILIYNYHQSYCPHLAMVMRLRIKSPRMERSRMRAPINLWFDEIE